MKYLELQETACAHSHFYRHSDDMLEAGMIIAVAIIKISTVYKFHEGRIAADAFGAGNFKG